MGFLDFVADCISFVATGSAHAEPQPHKETAVQNTTQAKVAEALPEGEICPDCKGAGNVMVQYVNQCYKCNGTGKLPLA